MGLSSLTKIDKFEKVAQLFYSVSLLAATEWWVGDNFADSKAASNAVVLCCAQIMGILCSMITAFSYLIRSEVTTKRILVKADYVTAAGWGACMALTVSKQALYQDDKFMINVGLQATITALYVYQSGLFPRLYQSAMKGWGSKTTTKPPPPHQVARPQQVARQVAGAQRLEEEVERRRLSSVLVFDFVMLPRGLGEGLHFDGQSLVCWSWAGS